MRGCRMSKGQGRWHARLLRLGGDDRHDGAYRRSKQQNGRPSDREHQEQQRHRKDRLAHNHSYERSRHGA